ncbi:MAG: hypothetical protein EBU67_00715 [Actinobacteria bacterium]|nr:hypothetical protein [Actinomycetota bacterium]NBP52821.1 hypothetical protein [Actinomycetota bacterium]
MGVRRARGNFLAVCIVGAFVLGACGGSDSSSNDETTADSTEVVNETDEAEEATTDTAVEATGSVEEFCKSALDNQGGADIAADDDPAAIAEKLSANAAALEEMASLAPSDVKADAEAVATAARSMAEAISGDPTLDKFNSLIEEFATSDANTASANVQTWVKANCEPGK